MVYMMNGLVSVIDFVVADPAGLYLFQWVDAPTTEWMKELLLDLKSVVAKLKWDGDILLLMKAGNNIFRRLRR